MPKASPELLEEHRKAFGRAKEQNQIDLGDVDTFAEDIDYEEKL
jgi:hypothetical protein